MALPATCDSRKEMCSYCYEWIDAEEIWTDADNKRVCFDCEYFVDKDAYSNEDKREVKDDKSWFSF